MQLYTVYMFLTDDLHTDNDSTAVKKSDVNDGAAMQPQDSNASESESDDNHNDSVTLTDCVTV